MARVKATLLARTDGLYLVDGVISADGHDLSLGPVVHLAPWCDNGTLGAVTKAMVAHAGRHFAYGEHSAEADEERRKVLAFARARSETALAKGGMLVFIYLEAGTWTLQASRNPGGTGRRGFLGLREEVNVPASCSDEELGSALRAVLEMCTF